jgi:hypothetical protein
MQQLQRKYGDGRQCDVRSYAKMLDAVLTHPHVSKSKVLLLTGLSQHGFNVSENLVSVGLLAEKPIHIGRKVSKRKRWVITQKGVEWLKLAQKVLNQIQ